MGIGKIVASEQVAYFKFKGIMKLRGGLLVWVPERLLTWGVLEVTGSTWEALSLTSHGHMCHSASSLANMPLYLGDLP